MNCNKTTSIRAGSTAVILSRIVKSDASYLLQADVASIRVDVIEKDGGVRTPVDNTGTAITDGSAYDTPDASSTLSDTLQTDARWDTDSVGYNFAYDITLPDFVDVGYEVRVKITTTDDFVITIVQDFDLQ